MTKRVVITGLGVVSSIGIGKDDFWKNLISGTSGISPIDSFDTSGHATHIGGEVKNFCFSDIMERSPKKFYGRASQMAIAATRLALLDAGLVNADFKDINTCVSVGTTMGEIQEVEHADQAWIKHGVEKIDNARIFQSPVNNIPANIARAFGFTGRNRIFTTACAAGNYAIGFGYDLIRKGKIDLCVAGGADALSWIAFTGFNKVNATAPEKCQPFDLDRKGMIPGEGSGILIMESLESATKRGATIYAEVLGYGLSCDAKHMTNPEAAGIAECISNALNESGISADEVDYISAHGTGTIHNDKTECAAINMVFDKKKVLTSSIKSMLGHTMGAASAIEAIACCMALNENTLPPTINYQTPDPECDVQCVPNASVKKDVRVAINNGFAFGGNNSCVVFRSGSE